MRTPLSSLANRCMIQHRDNSSESEYLPLLSLKRSTTRSRFQVAGMWRRHTGVSVSSHAAVGGSTMHMRGALSSFPGEASNPSGLDPLPLVASSSSQRRRLCTHLFYPGERRISKVVCNAPLQVHNKVTYSNPSPLDTHQFCARSLCLLPVPS